MPFTPLDGIFVGAVLEGLFYGIYAVLFGIFISQQPRRSRQFKSPISIALTTLFILCTAYFAMNFPQYYFTVANTSVNPSIPRALNIAVSAAYTVIDFLCQCIMIYRCWIIWDKRWIIIALPMIMALTALGGEFALVAMLSLIGVNEPRSKFPQLVPTGNAAFSISLAVNTFVTALIVTKIWLSSRELKQEMPGEDKTYNIIISMLVESGLFTFIVQLIWVVTFALNRSGYYVVASSITMIYGITPTVLAIRVNVAVPYETHSNWGGTSLQFATTTSGKIISTARTESIAVVTTDVESSNERKERLV